MDFQDGQTQTIGGVTYVRQGGVWHPQSSGAVYGTPRTPTPQTVPQQQQDALQVEKLKNDLANVPTQQAMQQEQLTGEQLTNQKKRLDLEQAQRGNANPGTGEQQTAAGFYARALFANQKYGSGVPPRGAFAQELADTLPSGIVNTFTSPERQQAETFARDFVAATLRKESGAAINEQEYANQYARYFPQPGDSPETIANKAQLRQSALMAMKNMAGPAASVAEQGVQTMLSGADAEGQVGGHGPKQLTPEQQAKEQAFIATNPNPQQYAAFLAALQGGGTIDENAAAARLKALQSGAQYNPAIGDDPRAKALADQYMQQGGGAGAAFTTGAADAASLGFADELGAAGNAVSGALEGQGSFSDLYGVNSEANRLYEQQLQQQHPYANFGGEALGAMALPTFGASSAADLAKLGVAYGGAYGAGSGTDAQSRFGGAVEGAIAGGALGAAGGAVAARFRAKPQEIPPMVDPQTGQLNQPLEAMTPGQRVVKAEEYGINLPADAAGGASAARIGKGLDILPGSAGVMEDARRATESQVAAASDVVASRFGKSRTMNEAGAELQRGAQERIDRGKTVIGKAYAAIPIADTAQATAQNTIATLQQLTGRFQSNPDLAAAFSNPKLHSYLDALQGGQISWKDLKDFRSIVGEMIGDYRFGEGHSTSDLRALYAGLSEDMRNTAANQGPGALRAFERANNLNRQNEELIQGALTRILGPESKANPERAAAAVAAMTKGGKSTGDLRTLAQIKAATVKSGAWNEIASTLIRLGGQPANSAGRDFNPQTFVNWYADMAEPARRMLFGGTNNDLRKALDGFVAVTQRLQKVNALRNTSNTAGGLTSAGTALAVPTAIMAAGTGHPGTAAVIIGQAAGTYGMAKLWTNPGFVRLMTGYSKALASGNTQAVKSQIGRISALAATNPDLREPLIALQQRLLSAANDNVGKVAASPQDGQTNQQ